MSERTGPEGCWIIASSKMGKIVDRPVFWMIDVYLTKADAEKDATPGGTVVEALGKVYLFTVGDKIKPAAQATRMAEIGPLTVKAGEEYTAQYRESVMQPGAVSRTHLHSGPEVFYTESGETCLETPAGRQVSRKGVNIVAPEGEPMELMATGSEMRRGLVLVLHSSDKPHTTLVTDWHSTGALHGDPLSVLRP